MAMNLKYCREKIEANKASMITYRNSSFLNLSCLLVDLKITPANSKEQELWDFAYEHCLSNWSWVSDRLELEVLRESHKETGIQENSGQLVADSVKTVNLENAFIKIRAFTKLAYSKWFMF